MKGLDDQVFELNIFQNKMNLVLDIDSTIVHAISNYENAVSQ